MGDKTHDDPVRGREECCVQLSVGRLQGGSRVHWRIHLPSDEKQGDKSNSKRRHVSQTDWRLGLRHDDILNYFMLIFVKDLGAILYIRGGQPEARGQKWPALPFILVIQNY